MFSFVWPLSLVAPVVLYWLSRSPRFGRLRSSAAHPYNILGFFLVIVALDFIDVFTHISGGGARWFARHMISNTSEVTEGLLFFLLMSACIVVGVVAASGRLRTTNPGSPGTQIEARAATLILVISIAMTGVATLYVVRDSLAAGSLFHVAGVRQTFFRENALLQVFYATLVPAFILFLSRNTHRPVAVIVFLTISLLLLLPLGSRGSLFYMIIALAIALATTRIRLPAIYLYFAAPAVLATLIYARFLREQITDSFERYLMIRGSDVLLGGADFSMAEAIIVGVRTPLPRYPLESLIGMIFAVVPRAAIPWKPEGASAVFTNLADPIRWAFTKSEWLITGFVNLESELGIVGAAVAMLLLAAVWAGAVRRSCETSVAGTIVGASILGIVAYIFVRGDLYNVALFLWPAGIVFSVFLVAKRFVASPAAHRHADGS